MADVFTKAKRSEVMSRVRSTGNQDTEVKLARLMREHRITGWRRQVPLTIKPASSAKDRPVPPKRSRQARPDFIFRAERVAVFVDGCFWHGCPRHGRMPQDNRPFWQAKISRNQERDKHVSRALRAAGWHVLRIWECALARKHQRRTLNRLLKALQRPALPKVNPGL